MKKAISVLLALLLLFALTSCSAVSKADVAANGASSSEMAPTEEPAESEEGYGGWDAIANEEYAAEAAGEAQTGTAALTEKIIYSANLSLETTAFDQAVAAVEALVSESGGYIQNSSVNGDTRYNDDGTTSVINRYAYYTVAVPSEGFEDFLRQSGGIGNVTYQSRDAENITSQYTDTEARIESLKVQEERLLAMMEETGDLESLIALEERLSEVTYEIESYQRTLNNWDRRVAYSTVTLELWEVEVYTPTAPVVRTFGEKLRDAFSSGWKGFVRGIQSFVLFLAESLPTLVLLAVLAAAAFFGIRAIRRKKAAKRTPKKKPETPNETP